MNAERIEQYLEIYRDGLLNDTVPFWLKHAIDREYGGCFSALDRDGTLIDTDKSVWIQGRFTWLMSTLYGQVEQRSEWLEAANLGLRFLRDHCFDSDGRMFFQVTREGLPLRKRRYVFSESFAVVAYAAYAKATGDERARKEALETFRSMMRYFTTSGLLEPKVNQQVRPMKGLGVPMITIVTAQVLRETIDDPICTEAIDNAIAEIENHFMSPQFEAVLEVVGPGGEFIDHFEGRTINPGHALEAGWFILQESRYREKDARLRELGLRIIDWSWQWGWDHEYGGIIYFRDVRNLPVHEYWQDMKFWWPQNEAIIATLMAYVYTGEERFAERHQQAHDWAYAHFPDRQFGEWFGYLHRDGRISSHAKGSAFKGPFHLPRMQLVCWQLMVELKKKTSG